MLSAPVFLECHSAPAPCQKKERHSHFAPFDKKEWHSSFAPYFGSGAQEWRSKECRSLTHCKLSRCSLCCYGLHECYGEVKGYQEWKIFMFLWAAPGLLWREWFAKSSYILKYHILVGCTLTTVKGYQECKYIFWNIIYCYGLHACYSAVKGYQEGKYSEILLFWAARALQWRNTSLN